MKGKEALLFWAKRATMNYPDVNITNLTSSWRDGLAFCAIIHNFRPDLIDMSKLRKDDPETNFNIAFDVAESLGISIFLDVNDIMQFGLEPRSTLLQITEFYKYFSQTKKLNSFLDSKPPEIPKEDQEMEKRIIEMTLGTEEGQEEKDAGKSVESSVDEDSDGYSETSSETTQEPILFFTSENDEDATAGNNDTSPRKSSRMSQVIDLPESASSTAAVPNEEEILRLEKERKNIERLLSIQNSRKEAHQQFIQSLDDSQQRSAYERITKEFLSETNPGAPYYDVQVNLPKKEGKGRSSHLEYEVVFKKRDLLSENKRKTKVHKAELSTVYSVSRRYSDFLWLDKELGEFLPQFSYFIKCPEKSFRDKFSGEFRTRRFQDMLVGLLNHPVICHSRPVELFFETKDSKTLQKMKTKSVDKKGIAKKRRVYLSRFQSIIDSHKESNCLPEDEWIPVSDSPDLFTSLADKFGKITDLLINSQFSLDRKEKETLSSIMGHIQTLKTLLNISDDTPKISIIKNVVELIGTLIKEKEKSNERVKIEIVERIHEMRRLLASRTSFEYHKYLSSELGKIQKKIESKKASLEKLKESRKVTANLKKKQIEAEIKTLEGPRDVILGYLKDLECIMEIEGREILKKTKDEIRMLVFAYIVERAALHKKILDLWFFVISQFEEEKINTERAKFNEKAAQPMGEAPGSPKEEDSKGPAERSAGEKPPVPPKKDSKERPPVPEKELPERKAKEKPPVPPKKDSKERPPAPEKELPERKAKEKPPVPPKKDSKERPPAPERELPERKARDKEGIEEQVPDKEAVEGNGPESPKGDTNEKKAGRKPPVGGIGILGISVHDEIKKKLKGKASKD